MNTILPWIIRRGFHIPERFPDGAITLESASECDFPNPISFLDSSFGFGVCQFVPDRAGGRVSESVKSHSVSFDVVREKLEVLLELVDDSAAAGVDAEMVEGELEIGDVGFDFGVEELEMLRKIWRWRWSLMKCRI